MSDDKTLRVEVAGVAPPKREPAAPKQDDRLAVPAKPAAITAGNLATLAATGAAAIGGPLGLVAGGAALVAGGEVARRTVARRARRRAERERVERERVQRGGSPAAAGGRGGRQPGGRRTPGGSSGAPGGGPGAAAGGRSGSPKRTTKRHGGNGDGPLSRLADAARNSRPGRAIKNAARKTKDAASKAANSRAGKAAKAGKAAGKGPNGKGPNGNPKGGKSHGGAGADKPCVRTTKYRRVEPTVNRGTTPSSPGQATQRKPDAIKPPLIGKSGNNGRGTMKGNGNQSGQQRGASILWQAAKSLLDAAANYRPKGMLEVRDEAYELPATMSLIAEAISVRADANARESLSPELNMLYRRIAESLQATAMAARMLGPGFDALHKERVQDLLTGANPAGWDAANNGR